MAQSGKKNNTHRPRGKAPTHQNKGPAKNYSQVAERIREQVAPVIDSAGLYLENVKVGRSGSAAVVKVVVDLPEGPGGVDSDRLTDVSREISSILDDVDLVQGAYTLEVSTPGADRVLTEPRHFSRAQGRLLSLRLTNGEVLSARLAAVRGVTLDLRADSGQRSVELDDVASARVVVELVKPDKEEFDES